MKKKILLSLSIFSLILFSANAEVISASYEDGLIFPVGETGYIDVNFDGENDIQVDNYEGYINLSPLNYNACISIEFTSSSEDGQIMRTFEFGQEIEGMYSSTPNTGFEDEDDDSLLKEDGTLDEGWVNLEEKYLGFLNWNTMSTGWINVKIDITDQSLYVLSQGIETTYGESIMAGDVGALSTDFSFTMEYETATFTNSSLNADTYYWTFGDGNASVEENPTHTYLQSGFYNVCLLATNDSETSNTCKTVNAVINGIEDFISESIELYPNPTKAESQLRFEIKNAQEISFSIYDVIGSVVAEINRDMYSAGQHSITLPVNDLRAGQYFISLIQGSEVTQVLKLQKVN